MKEWGVLGCCPEPLLLPRKVLCSHLWSTHSLFCYQQVAVDATHTKGAGPCSMGATGQCWKSVIAKDAGEHAAKHMPAFLCPRNLDTAENWQQGTTNSNTCREIVCYIQPDWCHQTLTANRNDFCGIIESDDFPSSHKQLSSIINATYC